MDVMEDVMDDCESPLESRVPDDEGATAEAVVDVKGDGNKLVASGGTLDDLAVFCTTNDEADEGPGDVACSQEAGSDEVDGNSQDKEAKAPEGEVKANPCESETTVLYATETADATVEGGPEANSGGRNAAASEPSQTQDLHLTSNNPFNGCAASPSTGATGAEEVEAPKPLKPLQGCVPVDACPEMPHRPAAEIKTPEPARRRSRFRF
eukprot:Selendium_serpulae@DN6195_c0_g2_i5.p1